MSIPAHDRAEKISPSPDLAASRAIDDEHSFKLTPHCCRVCFGRVLMRETFDRRRVYRCACCETEREGKTEAAICCCGMKLKTGVDAGIRCQPNPGPTPEFPAKITAAQAEVVAKTDPQSVFSRS